MLKSKLPPGAMLARMGGDEFAMVLTGSEAMKPSLDFAQSVLDFFARPVHIDERSLQVGASIGVATADIKAVRSEELFRRADMAMYESKSAGKNRITLYDATLDAERLRKTEIEDGIRKGLENDEFDVVYQPIVEARSGVISSVEALVRWPRRPEGAMMPDQFIDVAECSGLIHPLGQFVLRKACLDLGAVPGLRLSVNLSPAQFRDPELEAKVAKTLEETGFPVERLELEVTEGYLIENPARAVAAIANLKALGVSMALDDFGTGYSSIGYLRRYAFDKIKIDKSLAGTVDRDPQAAALVAGTVAIAQALHISVTAEGVETEDHVRLLKLAGCQYLQGFYYSRPKPLAEVLEWCEKASADKLTA
ncbi:putative signaling protein [Asticcacaulis sp. MM231]